MKILKHAYNMIIAGKIDAIQSTVTILWHIKLTIRKLILHMGFWKLIKSMPQY